MQASGAEVIGHETLAIDPFGGNHIKSAFVMVRLNMIGDNSAAVFEDEA